MQEPTTPFFRSALRNELTRRAQANRSYSLRAFASALQIDPGALSRVLNGKQSLAIPKARAILDRMQLSTPERKRFLDSVLEERREAALRKIGVGDELPAAPPPTEYEWDVFEIISKLHHIAIMELTETKNAPTQPVGFARRLGLGLSQVKEALERLERVGLLKKTPTGWKKAAPLVVTKGKEATAPFLKKLQVEILARALASLEEPIERRVASSMTMAIAPEKIPLARELITRFGRELCEVLESGTRTQVYQLHINLFPLERQSKE
ncbi:TIGR02147 family protein [bacterium]|nr:TIGR02147 family protein [bacterium]